METIAESTTPAVTAAAVVATMASLVPPRIGEHWAGQGGVYIGIVRGRDGQPDAHKIAAIGTPELADVAWGPYGERIAGADSYHDGAANTAAMAAAGLELAKRVLDLDIEGHADWHLPSQAEGHLLAANVNDLLQPEAYWLSTQYSAYRAWCQDFGYGHQHIHDKDAELRAVAVRTIQIVNA